MLKLFGGGDEVFPALPSRSAGILIMPFLIPQTYFTSSAVEPTTSTGFSKYVPDTPGVAAIAISGVSRGNRIGLFKVYPDGTVSVKTTVTVRACNPSPRRLLDICAEMGLVNGDVDAVFVTPPITKASVSG